MYKKLLACSVLLSVGADVHAMQWLQGGWDTVQGWFESTEQLNARLFKACDKCDAQEIERLLARGAGVNCLVEDDDYSYTSLSYLLEYNSPSKKETEATPLSYLLKRHYPSKKDTKEFQNALALLLKHGAREADAQLGLVSTLIHNNDLPMVKLLVGCGAVDIHKPIFYCPINGMAEYSQTFLHSAAAYRDGDPGELITFILSQPKMHVDMCDGKDSTPLHRARTAYAVKTLINHRANIHALNHVGRTPLHKAARRECGGSRSDAVPCLLLHGASLCAQDNTGETPLHRLKEWCTIECPKIMRYVQSPQGIVDDEWHKIHGRVFTLWCCLRRLGEMPRGVRQMLERYTVYAETDGNLYDHLSVGQLGWLVKRNLPSKKTVLDTLVKSHFDTVGMALSIKDEDRNTPQQAMQKVHHGPSNSEPYERSFAWLDPEMTELKAHHTPEIRGRYQRVLDGLPQEEGRVEQDDEDECVIC